MKKYLLGFFALALALGVSAFSTNARVNQASGTHKVQPSLFWYVINADGSLGSALNGGAQMDKATALTFTPCQDITATDCDRGYSSRQVVGTNPAPPTNSSTDYHIRKNQ